MWASWYAQEGVDAGEDGALEAASTGRAALRDRAGVELYLERTLRKIEEQVCAREARPMKLTYRRG